MITKLTQHQFIDATQHIFNSPSKNSTGLDNSILLDIPHITEPVVEKTIEQIDGYLTSKSGRALKCIIWSLYRAYQLEKTYGTITYVAVSLSKDDYKGQARWAYIHNSYPAIKNMIEVLEQINLIKIHKGFRDREKGIGRITRLEYTDKLKSYFNKNELTPVFIPPNYPVKIKGEKGGLIEPRNKKTFMRMCKRMDRINQKQANQVFSLPTSPLLGSIGYQNPVSPENHCEKPDNFLPLKAPYYTRIFSNGSLQSNGRLSCNLQQLKKSNRKHLLINGNKTIEYDFVATFPRIAYALVGLELEQDPYVVKGFTRKEGKIALNCIFNCKNQKSAVLAMMKWLSDKNLPVSSYSHYKTLMIALEDQHRQIADYYYCSAWEYLMFLESEIAEAIIYHFSRQNIGILGIHDSFVVEAEQEDELIEQMYGQWYKLFGLKTKIKKEQ